MKNFLLTIMLLTGGFVFNASAQQFTLSGRITDSKNVPISYVSVYIRNSTYGTTTNEDGIYKFNLSPGSYDVIYRYVGYKERIEHINITDRDVRNSIQLEDEIFQLKTVQINNQVNRDTAAEAIMRKVIGKREYYLKEIKSYSCAIYVKGVQRLTKAPKNLLKGGVAKVLDLDSLGRGILYQSESISSFDYERPNKVKEVTISSRMAGITPTFSYNKASDLQANFYNNIFTVDGLSSHGFVSPVAENAFSYYRYKLIGSTVENGRTIAKIELSARRQSEYLFDGYLYIVEGDWRIYSVDLRLTNKINRLNLVDTMQISQQYIPVADSTWMPASIQYDYNGDVFGFKFTGYYISIYNNYKFNVEHPKGFFNGEVLKIDTAANLKNAGYWFKNRPVPLTAQETRDYQKKDSVAALLKTRPYLDSLQKSKNRFLIIPYTVFGYTATSRDNKDSLYVYPFNQTLFYNTVEGMGLNLKVRYSNTSDDFKTFSISPAVRYGFANKLLSANIHSSYTYDPFDAGELFLNFGNDILDLNNVGTRSLYFNTLSTLLSNNNYVKYYRSEYADLGFKRELSNGILWTAYLSYANRTQLFNTSYNHIFTSKTRRYTSNNPLAPDTAPAEDRSVLFPQNQALTLSTSVRFTFDQHYITRPTGKVYLPSAYPVLTVNYRKAIPGIFGADANYDFGSVDVSQSKIRLGLMGYSSFKLTAGDFFTKKALYFMDYNHFLGNQGTTFDPTYVGSFHFLPFYQFSANGAFLEAHYQHNFSGSLLGKIGFMRNLKLEEIIGANYLTEKNNPNYSEFYVGVQRFIFRIDYGVSYTGNKKYIQGIRIFYGIR
ncbi:DUF5686 and carboxypeptidase regulatory-like domain-containing protein [Mucilaginibacter sp. UR6-11]|uniref:DUF5686 and carboxypeptidase regulatory-like domain-containing protein n=1 Tax=Mucilaginibacter sp. UR6-11 TaxID=1435644 RepID=UPI001E423A90|nr:DUF5686 and carboxypeptidase regulatory-like domain-containing protein [Mucilaginibacter sp. UR6-11]MCC8427271.1 DUF5686 and carboxypeptidase regulatory-like domain-containing protein [Mucilaginibacter sp. UR6-11]